MNGLLTTADALKILKVTKKTLLKYIHAGQLKAYQLPSNRYRIRREDLEAFIGAGEEHGRHAENICKSSDLVASPAPTTKGD